MTADLSLESYLAAVTARLQSVLGDSLVGVYLFGSLAQGDYTPPMSDLDILAIVARPIDNAAADALTDALRADRLSCPAAGLEVVIANAATASAPTRRPICEYALMTGATWPLCVETGEVEPDLLLNFAICRAYGRALIGPPPREIIGDIPRSWLLDILIGALKWHIDHLFDAFHDPSGYFAVLNACRAWKYAATGELTSKGDGGRWALGQVGAPRSLIESAQEIRRGERREPLERDEIVAFVNDTIATIAAIAGATR